MTQKILRIGIWWPTLHKDAKVVYQTCDVFHRVGNPSRRDKIPLVSQVTLQAFDKWAVDFVGPINPPMKRSGVIYIIYVTYYLTRWYEAELEIDCSVETSAQFF
jgi:hypothetical protein